jgi:hypothetical protein
MELFFKSKMQEMLSFSDALQGFLLMHDGQAVLWRVIPKTALGVISAGTVFLANYYGGLSLPKQIFDNKRMLTLFSTDLPPDGNSLTDTHMHMLGRESIIESGGWYIAQKENAPGLFIV